MRYHRAKVKQTIDLIHIDTGIVKKIAPREYTLDTVEYTPSQGATYIALILEGTMIGSRISAWEQYEREGKLDLSKIAESNDPTLDGIALPITRSGQLTEHQQKYVRCGLLIKGVFHCERCALQQTLIYPDAISVYPINILPYSQDCHICGLQIFDIWKRKQGGPLNLFNAPIRS